MPAELVWLVLILGLVALAACWFMPREVGKEDEPIVQVHVDLPSIEHMSARMRAVRLPFHRAGVAPRTSMSELPDSEPAAAEVPPSPMGAPQPVLSQELPAPFALPGGGN